MERNSKFIALLLLLLVINSSLFAFQQDERSAKDTTNASVAKAHLNRGNEQDIFGLASGLLPGMMVSRSGSDPNLAYNALVRGVGTIMGNQNPLIVIDGLIGVPMTMIDVNDIASMTLLKGAATSRYGMQGANGVLEISTHDFYNEPLKVSFNQSVFLENKIYREKMMDAQAFVDFGGQDLGANTDWYEEISQSALSTVSNLAINGTSGKVSYYASANLRLVDGILKETGFDRYNFMGKLQWRPTDKWKIGYSATYTSNEADLGFGQSFKYANKLNPTSPVYFENGGLYNAIAFDYINPLSYVQDAYRIANEDVLSQSMSIERQIGKGKISLNGGYWASSGGSTTEYSPDFLFGYYVANSTTSAFNNEGYNATLSYEGGLKTLGSMQLKETLSVGTYSSKIESRNRRFFNGQLSDIDDTDELELNHFNVAIDAKLNSYINSQINLRYEQSSTLGSNNNSGIFPSVTAQIDLGQKFEKLKDFELSMGYGVSGLTLYDDDYAKVGSEPNAIFNFSQENPDLGYEKSVNSEIGLSYQPAGKPWQVSLMRYGRKASELMGVGVEGASLNVSVVNDRLLNDGEIMNSGWEVAGQYILNRPSFQLTSSLTASTLTTEWKRHRASGIKMGYFESGNALITLIEEGQPYGSLSGYEAEIRNGNIVFLDTNGDFTISDDDEASIGQALPGFWFGWRNELQIGKTSVSMMLEGMTGHSVLNSTNFLFGSDDLYNVTWNGVADRLGYEDFPVFPSSLFVEDASFVRLRYISVDQQLTLGGFDFTVYGVVNNFFTLTSFRGNDPSPRLRDHPQVSSYRTVLPGIQRTHEWLPSRSFMIGVKVQF